MKFWCSASFLPPEHVLDVACSAEDAGYHGVIVADHLAFPASIKSKYPYGDGAPHWEAEMPWLDPWVTIGAMAGATSRIRFTTTIYIAPARHPLLVAKQVSAAAVLSQGRVALGAGVGWMKEEFDVLGADFATRGRRLDEMIGILRKLWAGGMVEHHGRHYEFDALQISPVPAAPIPIYVGGDSEAALRRAAGVDGWIASRYKPDVALERAADMQRKRRQLGTDSRDDFEILLALEGPTDDLDVYRRLEDAGVTGIMASPAMGTDLKPAQAVHDFGERVVAPLAA